MRTCASCRHFESQPDPNNMRPGACYAIDGQENPVNGGTVHHIDAGLMRMTLCGWRDPKLWEAKASTR